MPTGEAGRGWYSPRGQDLLHVRQAIAALVMARDAMLDRVDAERALRNLLAP